jgi:hypothetical protein
MKEERRKKIIMASQVCGEEITKSSLLGRRYEITLDYDCENYM